MKFGLAFWRLVSGRLRNPSVWMDGRMTAWHQPRSTFRLLDRREVGRAFATKLQGISVHGLIHSSTVSWQVPEKESRPAVRLPGRQSGLGDQNFRRSSGRRFVAPKRLGMMHRPGVRRTGLGANNTAENLEPPITGHSRDSLSAFETWVTPRCQPIRIPASTAGVSSGQSQCSMISNQVHPLRRFAMCPPPLTTLPQRLPR